MDHEGYYAEAFYPKPGQCFRMVSSSTHGSPVLCPKRVETPLPFDPPVDWVKEKIQDPPGPPNR